jgi:RNA polymerase sigma-B factor
MGLSFSVPEMPALTDDVRSRNQVVELNQNLARKIAHRWSLQCAEPYEDLENLALIGLIRAVEKFDPTKEVAFSSFAVPYIEGEIQHFLRDHWGVIKVPRRDTETLSRVRRVQRKFEERGRSLSEDEAAAYLGITPEKWAWIKQSPDTRQIVCLEESLHAIPDDRGAGVDESTSRKRWLYQKLATLPELHRSIVMEHYFAEQSIEAIAKRRKVSSVVVGIWLGQAIAQLRGASLNQIGDRERDAS